jgi:hypothetical protein
MGIFTKQVILFIGVVFINKHIFSQSFAINTDGSTANNSALLDVKSTTKGILIPRMSKSEKNAIGSPATGLLVFQNSPDSTGFYFYNGTRWNWLADYSSADSLAWKTSGNTGINAAQHFIGTTNNAALVFKTNNTEKARITSNGELGIGTAIPNTTLQVDGSISVGVSMGLTGGGIGSPVSLTNQKTYIGCSPADNTNNFYQLPDPATCPGRIFYIRNNSSSFFANIVTAAGFIYPGSSASIAGGNTYTLNQTTSVKTVICISDGVNWTVWKID